MRKRFVFLLFIAALLIPITVSAQEETVIKKLNLQLWPEYDRPEMLVMYTFELADDTPLPVEVKFQIPANAELNAVAKIANGQMLTLPYETPTRDTDWVTLSFLIDEATAYRIEYYQPLEREAATRKFFYLWQNDLTVENLFVEFQQPLNSTDLQTEPLLLKTTQEGLIYHTLAVGEVAAKEPFRLEISYKKENDFLTVSTMPVEASGEPRGSEGFSFSDSLPSILVGIGVLLILGGLFYFFKSGSKNTPRKKHHPRRSAKSAKSAAGRSIYCHECGARAHAGDRFCRSCGAKLRI